MQCIGKAWNGASMGKNGQMGRHMVTRRVELERAERGKGTGCYNKKTHQIQAQMI